MSAREKHFCSDSKSKKRGKEEIKKRARGEKGGEKRKPEFEMNIWKVDIGQRKYHLNSKTLYVNRIFAGRLTIASTIEVKRMKAAQKKKVGVKYFLKFVAFRWLFVPFDCWLWGVRRVKYLFIIHRLNERKQKMRIEDITLLGSKLNPDYFHLSIKFLKNATLAYYSPVSGIEGWPIKITFYEFILPLRFSFPVLW